MRGQSRAWKAGAAALCAAGGLTLQYGPVPHPWTADCDASSSQPAAAAAAAAADTDAKLAALADWLRQEGADVGAIQFKQSDTDAGRYGVYAAKGIQQRTARGFWGTLVGWAGVGRGAPVAVAAFPLASTLTAANLPRDAQLGAPLARLMQQGLADERTAVILHLALQRQRLRQLGAGAGGPAAWLALLPATFSTTLYFSELDMQWLRGTTLHTATRLRQRGLREAWARLEPAARQVAEAAGLQGAPSLDDWLWANSVFWSRATALPTPAPDGGVMTQEGIVPGLDFCNHAAGSPCRWTAFDTAAEGSPPAAITLVCPRCTVPAPGREVTIDYGGKSNEELLFLYGFALPDNPYDVLTVNCPLPPPAEREPALLARLALLRARGLRPQLHLPLADLPRLAATAERRGGGEGSGLALPDGVAETLQAFVLDPGQLAQALEAADAGSSSASGGMDGGSSSAGGEAEAAGERMALLTTLVRLLELNILEMEGPDGTGPLEEDERLLAAAGGALPPNQRHALLYRAGQKRLARAYLRHASRLLQQQMAALQLLSQRPGGGK